MFPWAVPVAEGPESRIRRVGDAQEVEGRAVWSSDLKVVASRLGANHAMHECAPKVAVCLQLADSSSDHQSKSRTDRPS